LTQFIKNHNKLFIFVTFLI